MPHFFRFRTARLTNTQLKQFPKPARTFGFAGGVVVGTVAAAAILGGGANRNVLAIMDVSESMKGREAALERRLDRLRRGGDAPAVVRASGFGMNSQPRGLLQSLGTALEANPAVNEVYVFSDFACETPAFDVDESGGAEKLRDLLNKRQLYLGSLQAPPRRALVAVARRSKGGWIDENGRRIAGEGTQPDTGSVEGTVVNAEDGQPLADAEVRIGDAMVRSDARGYFLIGGVPAPGAGAVIARREGWVPAKTGFEITKNCEVVATKIPLTKLKSGELLVTLNWQAAVYDPKAHDLDLHFYTPGGLHRYYGTIVNAGGPSGAELPVDAIPAKGLSPVEVMHLISNQLAGRTYALDVCDFGDNGTPDGILQTQATVQVSGPNGSLKIFSAPRGSRGRRWRVFTIDSKTMQLQKVDGDPVDSGTELEGCLTEPRH
jgi:hypothetical protein